MTALVARILLAIIMLPLAVCLALGLLILLMRSRNAQQESAFLLSHLATGVFVILYWILLWRRSVRWTSHRVTSTWLSILGCVIVGILIGVAMAEVIRDETFGVFFGSVSALSMWLAGTVLIWRETAAERAERVRQAAGDVLFCPKCGYNMTGLYEARCPECGSRYTLDQLAAAQKQEQLEASS